VRDQRIAQIDRVTQGLHGQGPLLKAWEVKEVGNRSQCDNPTTSFLY
jgi:hypothetical protein